uniref:Uncharacterized protein n=1 Tax=Oryza sativa subsp. japonica TaxID=39947 RepID=Q10KV0_ORYSJ|nr:hypothetical protein LOC_Os03g25374 [Oryza sativa Japonica Group]
MEGMERDACRRNGRLDGVVALWTIQKKQNCGKNNEKAVKRKAPSPDSGSNEGNTSAEEQNKNSTGVKKGGKERKGKKKKKKKKKGNNPP